MDAPPVPRGEVHYTTDEPVVVADVSSVAETPVGASGTVAGMAAADAADGTPVVTEFVAVTVNMYGVPFVRPVTVHVVAGAVAVQVLD